MISQERLLLRMVVVAVAKTAGGVSVAARVVVVGRYRLNRISQMSKYFAYSLRLLQISSKNFKKTLSFVETSN